MEKQPIDMYAWAREAVENAPKCEDCGKPVLTKFFTNLILGHVCESEEKIDIRYNKEKESLIIDRHVTLHKPIQYFKIEGKLEL